jgi:hypothetical protein
MILFHFAFAEKRKNAQVRVVVTADKNLEN